MTVENNDVSMRSDLNADSGNALKIVKCLLSQQKVGVLATVNAEGRPHTSIVGFAASEDLKNLYFGTPRATLKFRNLLVNANVSLLIDNRQNLSTDFGEAAALTCSGCASCSGEEPDQNGLRLLLEKHPELAGFFHSPTCRIVRIAISRYNLVLKFQEVTEICMNSTE
ncbi:MAG: pyridoxamine 5'-phosphate oxidase family protein [Candidatus Rifleibacteriota bacterium]